MPILFNKISCMMLLLFVGNIMAAAPPKDKPGIHDHEIIGRYAGSVLVNYGMQNYAEIAAPLETGGSLKAAGKLFHYMYWAPAGRSSLEIYRNYEQALKAKGFTILYGCDQPQRCQQQGLQHYAAQWTRESATFADGNNYMDDNGSYPPRYLVASRETPQGNLYVTLTAKEPSSIEKDHGAGGPYYLQVLEAKPMQMDAVKILDAKAIDDELKRAGKVALYGIEFDTDSASIRPASQPQLRQMASVLAAHKQMKVFIVGHTDNTGAYEHNRVLSQHRAQAVIDALGGQGIDKKRLLAAGVANVAPVSNNDSEAGRARNRRVEMVVQ